MGAVRWWLLVTLACGCVGGKGDEAGGGDDDDDDATGDDDDGVLGEPVGDWRITAIRNTDGTTVTTPNGGSTYSVTGYDATTFAGSVYTVSIEADGSWSLRQEYTSTSDTDSYRNLAWYEEGDGFVLVYDYQDWECSFTSPDEVLCDVTVDYGHVERDVTAQFEMERV